MLKTAAFLKCIISMYIMLILYPFIGGSMLPPPYGAFPYVQSPQILPAVAPLTPRLPAAYYSPVFYWPYPSPPVSPTTYYPHSSTTVVSFEVFNYR